jgi:hypothetical protein
VATAFAEQTQSACTARLDGARFPYLVPEYEVWKDLFESAQVTQGFSSTLAAAGTDPQLSATANRALHAIASAALPRAAALKATPSQPGGVSAASAAAGLILDARDDLLRTLSATDVERLFKHLEGRRRQTRYTFAMPGVRATAQGAVITCRLSINGKEHPELVPEPYYWEFHLRVLASISEKHRTGPAAYSTEYMSVLREQRLAIPERDVVTLLAIASDTIRAVDSARAASVDSREAESAVAAIIRAARLDLLRRLPKDSWVVVQRDAANRRGGIEYDFPTTY